MIHRSGAQIKSEGIYVYSLHNSSGIDVRACGQVKPPAGRALTPLHPVASPQGETIGATSGGLVLHPSLNHSRTAAEGLHL